MTRGTRMFLVLASVWNTVAGAALMLIRDGRFGVGSVISMRSARASGAVVIAFGMLYAALAVRPSRALLIVGAIAKSVGGVTGVIGAARGRRDAVTAISLTDAAWMPGFVAVAAGRRGQRRR